MSNSDKLTIMAGKRRFKALKELDIEIKIKN
jgi:ParB-like chromosome segregation protein Spo0J